MLGFPIGFTQTNAYVVPAPGPTMPGCLNGIIYIDMATAPTLYSTALSIFTAAKVMSPQQSAATTTKISYEQTSGDTRCLLSAIEVF
jgi:hypothetical protein